MGILKDKIRILATHSSSAGKYADRVIVLNDGRLEYNGDFE